MTGGGAGGARAAPLCLLASRVCPSLSLAGALARSVRGLPSARGAGGARPAPANPLPGCPPGLFQCEPGAVCFPREWRCDGYPDCEGEGDESGCGTVTPAEPSPDGAWTVPPAGTGGGRRPCSGGDKPHRNVSFLVFSLSETAALTTACFGQRKCCRVSPTLSFLLWRQCLNTPGLPNMHFWLLPSGKPVTLASLSTLLSSSNLWGTDKLKGKGQGKHFWATWAGSEQQTLASVKLKGVCASPGLSVSAALLRDALDLPLSQTRWLSERLQLHLCLGGSVPLGSQGHMWILIIAVLLSILVAVGSIAVWSLSEAKSRFDILSVEKASREQLMPDQSQTGLFPQRVSCTPCALYARGRNAFLPCVLPPEGKALEAAFPSCSCCRSATCLRFQSALKQQNSPLIFLPCNQA
ncbi:CD320 antigen [Phalacrocorax carbo]|uniref:CD320 antigen n=1 Tax=Phalacrocorax carbo TaxID=9209 RepID=UPI00311A3E66